MTLSVISALLASVGMLIRSHAPQQLANFALRHQLAVSQQTVHRPRLRPTDRLFWVWLSHLWIGWQTVLACGQPHTIFAWPQWFSREQTWKTFLCYHEQNLVALDFFVVPTVRYYVLFFLLVMVRHPRQGGPRSHAWTRSPGTRRHGIS